KETTIRHRHRPTIERSAIVIGFDIRLFEKFPVDKNFSVPNFNFLVGQSNYTADKKLRWIAGIIIGNDVTAFKVADIFCYENPVTFFKSRFHGDACDLKRFEGMLRRSTASNKNRQKDAEEHEKDFSVRVHIHFTTKHPTAELTGPPPAYTRHDR